MLSVTVKCSNVHLSHKYWLLLLCTDHAVGDFILSLDPSFKLAYSFKLKFGNKTNVNPKYKLMTKFGLKLAS